MIGQKFIITEAGWRNTRSMAYFRYQIITDEKTFNLEETIEFPSEIPDSKESENLLEALHIALAISYYKAFLTPTIEHSYTMSNEQAAFWNTVYLNGLGEFLYRNSLSSALLAKFYAQKGKEPATDNAILDWSNNVILGIGGGKDSIVAGEFLKELGLQVEGFVLATGEILGQTKEVSTVMQVDLEAMKRTIDPQIMEINKIEGTFNGHIPISVIFGLVGALIAVSKKSRFVVVANEASASIPQVVWEGTNVNHQWSKSLEFELLFQQFLRTSVSSELNYFSAIRPLTSVAIAKIFSKYPQYFEVFTSDNSLFKIEQENRDHPRWSFTSSKSLSSFILLAPWLSEEELLRTFGRNFFDMAELSDLLGRLLGLDNQSVLDCVGTPNELKASISQVLKQGKFTDSALLTYTVDKQLIHDEPELQSFMTLYEHAIPEVIAPRLLEIMEQNL